MKDKLPTLADLLELDGKLIFADGDRVRQQGIFDAIEEVERLLHTRLEHWEKEMIVYYRKSFLNPDNIEGRIAELKEILKE